MSHFSLGTLLGGSQTYSGLVNGSHPRDSYQFNLNTSGSLTLLLNGLSADANLELLDSNRTVLHRSSFSGASTEAISVDGLAAGTYYAQIRRAGSRTNYTLSLTTDEAGNTLSTARDITVDATTTTYSDFVGSTDLNDYYRFSLSDRTTITLNLNSLSADADLQLLDSNGVAIKKSFESGTTDESIGRTLEAGTYYIRVLPYGSANTNYNLSVSASPVLEWTQQLGTSGYEQPTRIAVDSGGNVYTTGYTEGSLGGSNAGDFDAWLSKHDSSGNLLWIQQLGTSEYDDSYGVAVDSSGNVYITGETEGSLAAVNAGDGDAYLAKYDSNGSLLWTQQLGTSGDDYANGVAVDSLGNAYITGYTDGSLGGTSLGGSDAWLAKYDSLGNLQWTQLVGTAGNESGNDIAVDGAGNVYITGGTDGSFSGEPNAGSFDAFVAKYSSSGTQLWTQQLGTSGSDEAYGITVDSNNNVYITGDTNGSLAEPNAGSFDAFVAKYTSNGTQLWIQQFGTSGSDTTNGIAVDSAGNVYITGGTANGDDALVAKYSSSGSQLWIQQFGTSDSDYSYGIAIDSFNNVYLAGETQGSLGGTNAGDFDAWIFARFNADLAGNAISTASNLGTLSGSRTFSDFMDAVDTDDYYQFTLDATSNLNLLLSGLQTDADVRLLDSSGIAIASSTNSFSNDESINTTLNAGTYYIHLYRSDEGNTTYALNLSV